MSFRQEKTEDILKQLAANFIQRESNHISLITVTDVKMFNKLTKATIFVTILPEHKIPEAIDFLNRQRSDFREYIKKNSRLMKLPQVEFAFDFGEKNRQRIDQISNEDQKAHPPSN